MQNECKSLTENYVFMVGHIARALIVSACLKDVILISKWYACHN